VASETGVEEIDFAVAAVAAADAAVSAADAAVSAVAALVVDEAVAAAVTHAAGVASMVFLHLEILGVWRNWRESGNRVRLCNAPGTA